MSEDARLVGAELYTHTNDDNKDKDTGIYVYARTADGRKVLACCESADSSNDDRTEYNDGSDHYVPLRVVGWGITKAECEQFHVRIWQQTHGRDTWKFNARVTLYFSDGDNWCAEKGDIQLKNNGASIEFDAA